MTWLIELKVFSSLKGLTDRQITVEADSAEVAVAQQWPDNDIEWDDYEPAYFSVVTPPGHPLIAGRVTEIKEQA